VCQRYIELNPVRAGMAVVSEEYPWSSYHANGLGSSTRMWVPHEVYQALGKDNSERVAAYRELFVGHVDSVPEIPQ